MLGIHWLPNKRITHLRCLHRHNDRVNFPFILLSKFRSECCSPSKLNARKDDCHKFLGLITRNLSATLAGMEDKLSCPRKPMLSMINLHVHEFAIRKLWVHIALEGGYRCQQITNLGVSMSGMVFWLTSCCEAPRHVNEHWKQWHRL